MHVNNRPTCRLATYLSTFPMDQGQIAASGLRSYTFMLQQHAMNSITTVEDSRFWPSNTNEQAKAWVINAVTLAGSHFLHYSCLVIDILYIVLHLVYFLGFDWNKGESHM